jgi:uncharacterized coiled-coil protein SlyX
MSISSRLVDPARDESSKTADSDRRVLLRRALEALALAAALAFLPELARTRSGAGFEPHLGWTAVLLLAARDGLGGFFAGLIAVVTAIVLGSTIADRGLLAMWSRLDSGPNLVAFAACLTVSWIGSWHLRRQADLRERLRTQSARAAEGEASIETLHTVIATLRARVDRTSSSLSFLRDVAERIESKNPVTAAEGASDLALARTHATAAAVWVGMSGFQRLLAVRDARSPGVFSPLAIRDADLTVPIRKGNDRVGVLALWGLTRDGLDEVTEHDLAIIASWCAPALAAGAWRPAHMRGHAGSAS